MTTPTTAAGEALLAMSRQRLNVTVDGHRKLVAAIEAEAAAAARTALLDELEAAIEEMRSAYADTDGSRQPGLVEKRAVLAEINRRRP